MINNNKYSGQQIYIINYDEIVATGETGTVKKVVVIENFHLKDEINIKSYLFRISVLCYIK